MKSINFVTLMRSFLYELKHAEIDHLHEKKCSMKAEIEKNINSLYATILKCKMFARSDTLKNVSLDKTFPNNLHFGNIRLQT